MERNTLVDFDKFRADPTLTGLGFRVVAAGHNRTSTLARAPNAAPTLESVRQHLDLRSRLATSWVSITRSWRAALSRRQRFLDGGAQAVHIYVVDMEKILGNLLSASLLASRLRHEDPQLFRHEYLVWRVYLTSQSSRYYRRWVVARR